MLLFFWWWREANKPEIIYIHEAEARWGKDERIEAILGKLSECESGGRDDIKILDTNNKFSYSRYQYQWDTAERFAREFGMYPENIEPAEFENWLYDGYWQTELTRRVLTADIDNLKNWKNCRDKLKLSDIIINDNKNMSEEIKTDTATPEEEEKAEAVDEEEEVEKEEDEA